MITFCAYVQSLLICDLRGGTLVGLSRRSGIRVCICTCICLCICMCICICTYLQIYIYIYIYIYHRLALRDNESRCLLWLRTNGVNSNVLHYVCVYIYIYIHIHIYIYRERERYTHTYIHTYIHTYNKWGSCKSNEFRQTGEKGAPWHFWEDKSRLTGVPKKSV